MTFLRRVLTLGVLLLAIGTPARAGVIYDFYWDDPEVAPAAGVYAFTVEAPDILTTTTTITFPNLLATTDPVPDDFIGSVVIGQPVGPSPYVAMNFPGPNNPLSAIVINAWSGAFLSPGVYTSSAPGNPTLTVTQIASEPTSLLLLGTGLLSFVAKVRHRRSDVPADKP